MLAKSLNGKFYGSFWHLRQSVYFFKSKKKPKNNNFHNSILISICVSTAPFFTIAAISELEMISGTKQPISMYNVYTCNSAAATKKF